MSLLSRPRAHFPAFAASFEARFTTMRPFWTHVGRKAHQRLLGQLDLTLELGLCQSADGLDPANGLFDTLAHLQTGFVARMSLGAPIDGQVLLLGRHMGRIAQLSAALHEGLAVVVLSAPTVAFGFLVKPRIDIGEGCCSRLRERPEDSEPPAKSLPSPTCA